MNARFRFTPEAEAQLAEIIDYSPATVRMLRGEF